MDLLDAILAFALTLAAFATVVTILLEIAFRVLRLKSQDQARLIHRLAVDCFEAVREPAATGGPSLDVIRRKVLRNPFAPAPETPERGFWARWREAGTLYEDVSLEHTLRRLLEVPGLIGEEAAAVTAELQRKLDDVARKYDEYRSALAERFKRHAQWWSVVVGLVLAVVLNVDGLRILELYLQDPVVRQRAIEMLQPAATPTEAVESPQTPAETPPEAAESLPAPAVTTPDTTKPKDVEEEVARLRRQLDLLAGLDLPIGWSYFPYCAAPPEGPPGAGSSDLRCPPDGGKFDPASKAFLAWLLQVLVTGLLMGLGAPFWYDVARRLAAVRSAFGGKGSAEERHRGADGKENPWARKQLIERVVADFMTLRAASRAAPRAPSQPGAPANGA